jgi:hypothetical protein
MVEKKVVSSGRPKTSGDVVKKEKIRKALSSGEKYVSELSRLTGMSISTVYRYVNQDNGFMKDEVAVVGSAGTAKNSIVVYYALRSGKK